MTATEIEWTDVVWNPTTGCDRVSPGCDNCYALGMARRLKAMGQPKYQKDGDPRTSGPGFGITEHPDVLSVPLSWRKPRKVFVNSMSDLFHAGVSDDFIARVWAVMALTPHVTYQVLTKRHGRMRSLLGSDAFQRAVTRALLDDPMFCQPPRTPPWPIPKGGLPWPLPNVWLGVSAEDQKHADLRIPALLDTPAAVRWVSAEPLLSPLDLKQWLSDRRRESILGTGRAGYVHGPGGRDDLAIGEMDWRWRGLGAHSAESDESGAEFRRSGQLHPGDVQGWGGSEESSGSPNCLDGLQQATDPCSYGDQSQGWQQAQQPSGEPGDGDEESERAALSRSVVSEEIRPAGREELRGGSDRRGSHRDARHLGCKGNDAAGACGSVRDKAIDGVERGHSKDVAASSLDWIVIGGESGPGARPMDLAWAGQIISDCQAAGVPVLMKQMGVVAGGKAHHDIATFPPALQVREYPAAVTS